MPDKPATVAAYAAGASLAAITLFYVFGPTFFIDGDSSTGFFDNRKRTAVGLTNLANDCFINSVLQALAGLGELRLYLIRETHKRELDGADVYESLPVVLGKDEQPERLRNLQRGIVTEALKNMLAALNERALYKKTIAAKPMIDALERSYQTRISRNQQDAQEFLQIVLERLDDEYKAGRKARTRHGCLADGHDSSVEAVETPEDSPPQTVTYSDREFPFEGRIETQIQCMYCAFKTKPSASTFVSLTLNVPQVNATTLDRCFDILLKTEEIEDFRCDRCRLKHALEWKKTKLASASAADKEHLLHDIAKIEQAIRDDPEIMPAGVELPDSAQAPKRRIKKYSRITTFPKIVAIHLSRSLFDGRAHSSKNLAKITYTERLRLGGILNQHWYKLYGVVCHKGSHNSGHYESFRRNYTYVPFSTPDTWAAYAAASRPSSSSPSPVISTKQTNEDTGTQTTSDESSLTTSELGKSTTAVAHTDASPNGSPRSAPKTTAQGSNLATGSAGATTKDWRRKKADRWWRISDDKVKEAKTAEVLNMQREVYLLFYELEKAETDVDE